MMKYLFRKLLRDVRTSAGQYIAITLVVLLGVAFYVGLTSASVGVGENVERFYTAQKLADLWVNGTFDKSALRTIRALPGVETAGGRTSFTVTDGESEFITHTLVNEVNVPFIEKGRLPKNKKECIIDRGYFEKNHLRVGDKIGGYSIVGVFNSPEYLYLAKNITEVSNHEHYGALFIGGKADTYNEIVVRVKPGTDISALKNALKKAAPQSITLDREKLFSWYMLNDDINQFGKVGRVFPIIFFLVAAAIIFISMSKNVEIQRGQIGNMKALGLRKRTITFHFLSYTLLTCALGSFLGALIGVFAFMPAVQTIFTALYTMPRLRPAGFGENIVVATVLAFAFGVVATLVSVRRPLRETPASAMRPKVPKKVKPILLERNENLWAKLSFGRKIVLRNLFLNKGRALLSSLGIIGCIGLMVAAFSFHDVFNYLLHDKFSEMNRYDAVVSLKMPTKGAFPLDLRQVKHAWGTGSVPAGFESGDNAISTDLIALDANNTAIALYDKRDNLLALPTSGVLIPQLYADKYGLAVGDTLTLTLSPLVGEQQTLRVKIAGVAMEYLGQDIYTSFAYLESIGEVLPVSSFYVTLTSSVKAKTYVTSLKNDPAVKLAMTRQDMMDTWATSLNIMGAMVAILVVAAAILSLTVVYNISAINILERRRDVATLKVLGYRRAEVNRLVFQENLLITGFGSVFGIGAGAGFLWLIYQFVMSDELMVPYRITPLSIVYAVVLGFAFTVLANQMLRGKIRRIDMVESLKSVE